MNTTAITRTTRSLAKALGRNSPTILTGLGVAGLITTVILAVKATPKAMIILEEEHKARSEKNTLDPVEELEISPLDVVELTWKCYIPTVVMGAATIACIIGSNSINLRRNAALASLYSIADTTLREYQAKVVEQIGQKKEEKLREDIAQDKLNNNPLDRNTIIITGKGDMLCYDAYSGRYFKNDIETLRRIQNDFNARLFNGEWELKLNELYYEMGLEAIDVGNEVGWSANNTLKLEFTSKLATDGQPAIVVSFSSPPKRLWP